ncbi:atrial natriuretic peptide receptor 1-like [Paramacrobiotus metropolitanus]|uniref:atrial natriuretic peptide receptor 1-like n=1 Tax=Paramacrobiotus metropolitanus TaxID=2943436 RepID=UPI00244574AA|nr:atrial natriuretic peptide receptor 1-like [Paramacrobiotus metropolitanus]
METLPRTFPALLTLFTLPCVAGMNITIVTVAMTNIALYGYQCLMPTYDAIFPIIQKKYPTVYSHIKRLPVINMAKDVPPGYSYECDFAYEYIIQYVGAYYQQHPEIFEADPRENFPVILAADWCDAAQIELARFVTAANVFYLDLTPANGLLDQFQLYPTTAEWGVLPGAELVAGVAALLLKFGWTKSLGMWCPTAGMLVPPIFCDIFLQTKLYNKVGAEQFYVADGEIKDFSRANYKKVLSEMRYRTRVILVFLFPKLLREFMVVANEMNMTNGDYVFLTLAFELYGAVLPDPFTWRGNDQDDPKAFQAYQSVIAVSEAQIDWNALSNLVDDFARISNTVYNFPISPGTKRTQALALMYHLLMNFADVVNKSWGDAENFRPRVLADHLKHQMYDPPDSPIKMSSETGSASLRIPILRLNTESREIEQVGAFDNEHQIIIMQNPRMWLWHNQTTFPSNDPLCGFDGLHCPDESANWGLIFAIVALFLIIIIVLGVVWFYRRKANQLAIAHMFINASVLTFETVDNVPNKSPNSGRQFVSCQQGTLQLENQPVFLELLVGNTSAKAWFQNAAVTSQLLAMYRLTNENVGRFYGMIANDSGVLSYLMCEFAQRGSLWDVVQQKNILSDTPIRLSFLHDAIKGLNYIHTSHLQYHGNLSAHVCFINSRFTLKISQAGYQKIFSLTSTETKLSTGSRTEDIYQFGKMCNEVLADADAKIMQNQTKLTTTMADCVNQQPAQRPTSQQLLKIFQTLSHVPRNVVSHMLSLLDRQTHELEEIVRVKTADLIDEMHKSDLLLAEMLPKSIIQRLRNKEQIPAESFDSVSILFSDIPAFAEVLKSCPPIEIINILNNTHSAFDDVMHRFDAYKVETIGDCYMISSGVPLRNDKHAVELCVLAHALLKTSHSFRAGAAQDILLTVRIGIHTGQVVACVIGTKSPRYCLFGDTVNTASRMESTGSVGKIHVSPTTYEAAVKSSMLNFVSRGEITVKGKGLVHTYWMDSINEKKHQ